MYQRDDGIVEFDPDVCIGCKACLQACPYDAIHIDPESGTAAKCHFCSHRIEVGLEPACVVVCPEHAILAGDMDDPESEVSQALARSPVTVRKPEQGTVPKLFYIGGTDISLHPTAAESLSTGMMFSDVKSGHAPRARSQAGAPKRSTAYSGASILKPGPQGDPEVGPIHMGGRQAGHMVQVGWNAQHEEPWHWPIPAYLVTKGLGGGLMLVAGALLLMMPEVSSVAMMALSGVALVAMTVTFGLLIYDLERPERFFYLFLRPQWKSWVARAAWLLGAFFGLTALWWGVEWLAWRGDLSVETLSSVRTWLVLPTMGFGLMTGMYTAFLLAQAEGRDFWQSPVTPVHMAVQTVYLGGLGGLGLARLVDLPGGWMDLLYGVSIAGLAGSLFVILMGEFAVPRASETATRAARDIQWGAFRNHFWLGGILLGHGIPLALLLTMGPRVGMPALLAAMVGMFFYGYAFIMAPQRIPNS
jgi:formate-dependent nitrite reductase membrane component NrfD/Pyruvate/2-oxoacid:ferredoxin oxidoreductase delta subunit